MLRILRTKKFDPFMIIPTRYERDIEEYLAEVKDPKDREELRLRLLSLPDELKKDIYMNTEKQGKFTYDIVEMVLRKG